MLKKLIPIPLFLIMIASSTLAANRFIPFQGRLSDGGGQALNGLYKLIFIIYDEPTGGTALWTEEHQDVSVINGMVNVILGTKTNLDDPMGDGSNQSIYFTNHRYLGITVGTNSNQEMVPRHQLVPSFQANIADRAFEADHATVADNAARLDNQLPSYYATKTSVDDVSADIDQRFHQVIANTAAIRAAVPAGTIMTYMGETLPSGYLLANGQSVAVAEYPELYAAIGTMYGSTIDHFNLPDLRGQFLRGWANGQETDPDRAARSDRGDGTNGDVVGSKQDDAMQKITGFYGLSAHVGSIIGGRTSGVFSTGGSYPHDLAVNVGAGTSHDVNFNNAGSTSPNPAKTSDYETRPKNISVMYIIKY